MARHHRRVRADTDAFLVQYNTYRPRQGGAMNDGMQQNAFTDGLPSKETAKMIPRRKAIGADPPGSGTCQTIAPPVQAVDNIFVPCSSFVDKSGSVPLDKNVKNLLIDS